MAEAYIVAAARTAGGRWISPGAVVLPSSATGYRTGALLRDPDGHGLLLTAP